MNLRERSVRSLHRLTIGVAAAAMAAVTMGAPASAQAAIQVELNSGGGTTASNGLRVIWNGSNGQMQIRFKGENGIWPFPSPANDGFFVSIPGLRSDRAKFVGDGVDPIVSGDTITDRLTTQLQGVDYFLDVAIHYVSPRGYVDMRATLSAGAGAPDRVYAYWGADTMLAGNDKGSSYMVIRNGKREVGTSNSEGAATGVTLWTRYESGPEWTGWFAGYFNQYSSNPVMGRPYDKVIDPRVVDSGFGWNTTVDPATQPTMSFAVGYQSGPPTQAPPKNLTADPGPGTAKLSWDALDGDLTGYRVRYKRCGEDDFTDWPFSGTGTSTMVSGLDDDQCYVFQVAGVNRSGVGDYASVQTTTPRAPRDVVIEEATAGVHDVELHWSEPDYNASVDGYIVQYATEKGEWQDWPHRGTGRRTTITGLKADTTYRFRVAAEINGNRKPWSDVWIVDTLRPGPGPAEVAIQKTTPGLDAVKVHWSDPDTAVDGYVIEYATENGDWKNWPHRGTDRTTTVTGLRHDTKYRFRVAAEVDGQRQPWSSVWWEKTLSADPEPIPPKPGPDPTPGQTVLTVTARPAGRQVAPKQTSVLIRSATSNATQRLQLACLVGGVSVKGARAERICGLGVRAGTAYVTATPSCGVGVSLRTTLTARAEGAARKSWTRTWKVSSSDAVCRTPAKG